MKLLCFYRYHISDGWWRGREVARKTIHTLTSYYPQITPPP